MSSLRLAGLDVPDPAEGVARPEDYVVMARVGNRTAGVYPVPWR